MMRGMVSPNRMPLPYNVAKKVWCYIPQLRNVSLGSQVHEAVPKTGFTRFTYGTRHAATQISSELNCLVSRKSIRYMLWRPGWTRPSRTKQETIQTNKRPPYPKTQNQFLELDMSYIWCGTDGWDYNVIDAFTKQWLAPVVMSRATHHKSTMLTINAEAIAGPILFSLTLKVDNGSQYTSRKFRSAVTALRISLEHICINMPDQSGHIETIHKTLKKEYIWPHDFADIQGVREATLVAFEDCNHRKIYFAMKCLTLFEFIGQYQHGPEGVMPNIVEGITVNKVPRRLVSMREDCGRLHTSSYRKRL